MRHILNLETCISIIAAYFYGKFITMLAPMKKQIIEGKNEDPEEMAKLQEEINDTRYVDWMITTPIMLLVLVLAFQYNTGLKGVKFSDFVLILLMNYGMLGSGYLGEKQVLQKPFANVVGFGFFAALYGCLLYTSPSPRDS